MKIHTQNKSAFTMIELVLVIVVLGILAALAMPRLDRDLRQEAKDNILSAIRYTQHLALNDDKTDPTNNNWQANLWNIAFQSDGSSYTVSSGTTVAINPIDGKAMDGTTPNTLIGKKYGVKNIKDTSTCPTVGFDNLGRPFTSFSGSVYAGYRGSDCNIIVEFEGGITDLTITIAAETGYVSGD
jgi:prepilin-type N-terminal cleavage/methylation domain-containing protein